jgi:hypothetical protein
VVNIIVLWNTLYIDAALQQLRAEGFPVLPERRGPLVSLGLRAHQSARPLCLFGTGRGPAWATTSPSQLVRSNRGALLIP